VGELAIDGDAEDLGVAFGELFEFVVESDDFGGANKGEIERVEEEDHILAEVIVQVDGFKIFAHNGLCCEVWSGLGDKCCHDSDSYN
jgi:hypothetical protein